MTPSIPMGEGKGLSDAARTVAELQAITATLRLGGLDTLRTATITHHERGVVLTLRSQEQADDR